MSYMNNAIEISINDDKTFLIHICGGYIDIPEEKEVEEESCGCCISKSDDGLNFTAKDVEELKNLLNQWVPKLKPITDDKYKMLFEKTFKDLSK